MENDHPDQAVALGRQAGRLESHGVAEGNHTLHRHYDPYLMRFTSPDPLAAPFYNLFHYAHNNPARYYDPDGEAVPLVLGVAAVVVLLIAASEPAFAPSPEYTAADYSAGREAVTQANTEFAKEAIPMVVGGGVGGLVKGGAWALTKSGLFSGAAGLAAGSASWSVTHQAIFEGEVDPRRVAEDTALGLATGGVLYGGGRLLGAGATHLRAAAGRAGHWAADSWRAYASLNRSIAVSPMRARWAGSIQFAPSRPAQAKEIALGLDPHFKYLAEKTGAVGWRQWNKLGLTRRPVESPARFGRAFHDASKRAERIHFALDGIGDVQRAVKLGARGFVRGNFTNAELASIARNPALLKKTIFYRNGKPVASPFG
jgi:RHS repeat-associated protein